MCPADKDIAHLVAMRVNTNSVYPVQRTGLKDMAKEASVSSSHIRRMQRRSDGSYQTVDR